MIGGVDVDRGRMGWIATGMVLSLAVAFVVYSFLGTFMFGLFLYYATRPVYDRLKKRVERPSVAAAVSLLTLAVPVLLLFLYTLAIALQEFNQFASRNDLAEVQNVLAPYINASTGVQDPRVIFDDPRAFFSRPGIQDAMGSMVGPLLDSLGIAGNLLIHLFVMIVLAYYLLKDGRRLSAWFRREFGDERGIVGEYFRAVDRDFQNIFFGNILNAFLTSIIGVVAYSTLDALLAPPGVSIPYAALAGLLTGVGSLIPVVGMKLVYFPLAAYIAGQSYLTGGTELLWFPVLFVVVSLVVVDVIPDMVLRPYVSGRELHLGAVMLAYTFGPLLWGWYGIFLGPVVLVLVFHFARVVVPELVEGKSLRPYAIDPGNMNTPSPSDGDGTKIPPGDAAIATDGSRGARAEEGTSDRETSDEAADRSVPPDAGDATENAESDDQ